MKNKKIIIYGILFSIVALGFFLRFHNIENTPPGIFPDEAMNGEDAIKSLQTGDYKLFYADNEGREGLFMNIIALCFRFFGISILTLKIPSVVFSTLTILGTYLLTKELFKKERVALISAFLVCTSYWSINFGRISFRANMLPFVLVFSFYFFFRGIRTKKWWDFAASGLIFGVGAHTYIAWRIAPLVLLILLLALILSRKDFFKEYWKLMLAFLIPFMLVISPIAYVIYAHPEYFYERIDSISILSPAVNKGNLVGTFLQSFSLSLIKYNLVGDQNWRHNYPPYPILDIMSGIAFVFGLIYSIKKLLHACYLRIFKKIERPELEIHVFLISWFFLLLAPEFMTAEGNPHALRSIGTLPVVFIFGAITFEYLFSRAERHHYFHRKIMTILLFMTLAFIGLFNPIKYFYFWADNPKTAKSFDKNLIDISRYIRTLPEQKEKFIVNSFGPYHSPLDRLPISIFNTDLPNTTYLYSWQNFDQIRPQSDNFIVVLTGKDADTEDRLKIRFPDLTLQEIRPSAGSVYYILNKN